MSDDHLGGDDERQESSVEAQATLCLASILIGLCVIGGAVWGWPGAAVGLGLFLVGFGVFGWIAVHACAAGSSE